MTIVVDDSAVKRVQELRGVKGIEALMLRVTVEGGGCSGFQYKLDLTDQIRDNDQTFANTVVTDDISLSFLKDSVVRFENALIGSEFKIDNPNAIAGCGCGTSFSV